MNQMCREHGKLNVVASSIAVSKFIFQLQNAQMDYANLGVNLTSWVCLGTFQVLKEMSRQGCGVYFILHNYLRPCLGNREDRLSGCKPC